MSLEVAVVIKQVPLAEIMTLGPDGRLRREGVEAETNPYCRRALAKAVDLVHQLGGRCSAFSLGPPPATECLREAIACGADRGILVSDPAFGGSDTLATSRALAAALEREGRFDLVLAGRSSVDADTGQVPPELAELLGFPFIAAARSLELRDRTLRAECEGDDGWSLAEVELPAVVSCAERLCPPAKASPEQRAAVEAERIVHLDASTLGSGPWGAAGSPTRVGAVRRSGVERLRRIATGSLGEQVRSAAALVDERSVDDSVTPRARQVVPDGWQRGPALVGVLAEPGRPMVTRELLGAAALLAQDVGGSVCALVVPPAPQLARLGSWGADSVVEMAGSGAEEDLAGALSGWCRRRPPWAVIAPGTTWGREVAARAAARLGAGLIGDVVAMEVEGDNRHLVGWKPAFGGSLLAAVTATSGVQMVTARPGVLALPRERAAAEPSVSRMEVSAASRVRRLDSGRDDLVETLAMAPVVVGVGMGVEPDDYGRLRALADLLGAELAATRKVTDRHWLPRSRQVGITGRSIAPRLYVAVGISGKLNHMVGVRSAGTIVAINADPGAPVFHASDIGLVGDWRKVLPLLVEKLTAQWPANAASSGS